MAKCRFCGLLTLTWVDLNAPPPRTVAPPGSTLDEIRSHDAEQTRIAQRASRDGHKWQLRDREGNKHVCPLNRMYYARDTSIAQKSTIDHWLYRNPDGTTDLTLVFPPSRTLAAVPPTNSGVLAPLDLTQVQPLTDQQLQNGIDIILGTPSLGEYRVLPPRYQAVVESTIPDVRAKSIQWLGEWDPNKEYTVGDVIIYKTGFFCCRVINKTRTPGDGVCWKNPTPAQMKIVIAQLGNTTPQQPVPKIDIEKRAIKI